MRVCLSIKYLSRIIYICDLTSNRYRDLSHYKSMGGNSANASCSEGTHTITPIPSVSSFHMQQLMFWVLLLVRGPSERSSEVIPGHSGSQQSFKITRYNLKIERRN